MRLLLLDPDLADDPDRAVRNLRFAADGRAVAAVLGHPDSGRRVVVRYDLQRDAGTVIPEPSGEDENREDAPDPAVSPDLELVAEVLANYAGYDQLRLTDTWARPPEVVDLPPAGDGFALTAAGFAAGGGVLLLGVAGPDAGDCRVLRWDVGTLFDDPDPAKALLDPLQLADNTEATAFADSPDGQTLAVGTGAGTAVLFDLTGTRRPLTVTHRAGKPARPVRGVLLGPDGAAVVTRAGPTAAVWDVATGGERGRLGAVADLAFTPDGRFLLAAGADGGVSRFAADTLTLADRFAPGLGPLSAVAVAPDGLTAAAGGAGGRVVVWDL